jgi:hypothetical protein
MTQEQIIDAGIDYTMSTCPVCMGGAAFEEKIRQFNRNASFEAGAKWAKEQVIKEACEWLKKILYIHTEFDTDVVWGKTDVIDWVVSDHDSVNEFIEAFKKAMEE